MIASKTIIGLDVGGTKIFAARFTLGGEIEAETVVPTEAAEGKDQVVDNLIQAITNVLDPSVQAIGIAWAGFVDSDNGIVRRAPNIPGFKNFALAEEIEKRLGLPSFIENDARLFAYAEASIGVGRGSPEVLGLVIGTGVGSGMVLKGKIFRGYNGFAGEVGQTFFSLERDETAEYMLAGPALHRHLQEVGLTNGINENVIHWVHKNGQAYEVFEAWLERLSRFTVNMILAFNPSTIVFGGGIGINILPTFLPQLSKNVCKLLDDRSFPSTVDLRIATLKNAGALGAALFVRRKLEKEMGIF